MDNPINAAKSNLNQLLASMNAEQMIAAESTDAVEDSGQQDFYVSTHFAASAAQCKPAKQNSSDFNKTYPGITNSEMGARFHNELDTIFYSNRQAMLDIETFKTNDFDKRDVASVKLYLGAAHEYLQQIDYLVTAEELDVPHDLACFLEIEAAFNQKLSERLAELTP
ncbi:MAG: hypothetical protein H7A33_00285 [Deltaproteobacteria bacterium]|nr:hypothetical protein [Deltaproteobacteria bacterium]